MVRFISLLCLTVSSVAAFSTSSSFGGSVVSSSVQNGATMEMKKGKANVPPQMRGQFKKQQETAANQRQMVEAQRPGSDGMPVFNLFVRTKLKNVSTFRRHDEDLDSIIHMYTHIYIYIHMNAFLTVLSVYILLAIGYWSFAGLVSMWLVQGR
jgi:hypothetical protein